MINKKPKVILASYPRSGNTFMRNILFEVYSLFSWDKIEAYHKNIQKHKDLLEQNKNAKFNQNKLAKMNELEKRLLPGIIKTHELPEKIVSQCEKDVKIIYIVRDGRDALVSQAYHNVNIVNPGSNYNTSLVHSIMAPAGTHFGGWSKNVEQWKKLAHRLVYFEELIKDPLKVTESFREFMDLPAPNIEKLPTFNSQKEGKTFYGGNSRPRFTEEEREEYNKLFYRKGKIGDWEDEMNAMQKKLFKMYHGKTLKEMGYK